MKGDRDSREFYIAVAKAAFLVALTVGLLLLSSYWA